MDRRRVLRPAEGRGKNKSQTCDSIPTWERLTQSREREGESRNQMCVSNRLMSLASGNASTSAFLPCSSLLSLPFQILTHAPLTRDDCIVASLLDTSTAEIRGTSIGCVLLGHFYWGRVTGELAMTGGYRLNGQADWRLTRKRARREESPPQGCSAYCLILPPLTSVLEALLFGGHIW